MLGPILGEVSALLSRTGSSIADGAASAIEGAAGREGALIQLPMVLSVLLVRMQQEGACC